ncbi:MAG: endonuclease/exonuclease/phosphatase family protein [Bacteroidota bacterium]
MKRLSLFLRIVWALNLVFVLLLLLLFLLPSVSVESFSSLSILVLVAPQLVVINLLFVLFWLYHRKRQFLLSLGVVLFWVIAHPPFYKLGGEDEAVGDGHTLSIMTFNVRIFNKYEQLKKKNVDSLIIDLIQKESPDILCFQESPHFLEREKTLPSYPYHFVDFVYGAYDGKVIQSIFSKYPIVQVDSLPFKNSNNNAVFADILFQEDTLRVYNIHLESFKIIPEIDALKEQESSKLFSKTRSALQKQYDQGELIRQNMAKTRHPKIVVGDFNNTQYSKVYDLIKGNFSDSYQEKGSGFGKTYDLMGFPMRIDHILSDSSFEVLAHKNYSEKLSDHYPVKAVLRYRPH